MGLDQNAWKVDKDGEREELAYWRKHNRLQGWMEERYTEKGGKEQFNCVDLELTEEDIDDLETAIEDRELPETAVPVQATQHLTRGPTRAKAQPHQLIFSRFSCRR